MVAAERPSRCLAALLITVTLCGDACAESDAPGFWGLQLENDLWGSNDDRFYTSGWQLSYASQSRPPEYLLELSDWLPFYFRGETAYYGFSLGQQIFTPEDIEATELIEDDRPYAGWLFVERFIGHRYYDRGDREKLNGLIVTLGIVGPAALGEEAQEMIHDLTGSDNPAGWDNQLENELGFNLTYLHGWRRIFAFDSPLQTEFDLHTSLTLGNVYTYAALGVVLRWGTHLKNDIGPPTISPGLPGLTAFNPNSRANWYFYAGLEGRAVARNIFLDGNTNVDSHSVDKKPLVGDLQAGFVIHSRDLRLSLGQLIRSKEFDGQSEHSQYGLINFTLFVG